jgi:DNA repair protein SbcC/Rad50
MQLHVIRLHNLNSLRGEWTLSLDEGPLADAGLFAITGDTGAGKTTILDAITLALFGKTNRDHQNEVMSYGTTSAQAEVEFTNEKGRFLVRWQQTLTKRKANPLQNIRELAEWRDGQWHIIASGPKEVDSYSTRKGAIEQFLGLNYEQFKRTVLLAQGEFAAFLNSDERNRSAVLERLTDAEIYTQLSKAAHVREREAQAELKDLEKQLQHQQLLSPDAIAALQAQLAEWQTAIDTLRPALAQRMEQVEQLRFWQQIHIQLIELAAQQQAWQLAQIAFTTDAQRLQLHRQILPLTGPLTRWQQARETLQYWSEQAELFWSEQTTHATTIAAANLQLTEHSTALTQHQQALAARQQLWTAVEKLDIQLTHLADGLAVKTTELTAAEATISTLTQQFEQEQDKLTALNLQWEQCQQWLANHPNAGQLGIDLTVAEEKLNGLRQIAKERLTLKKNWETAQQQAEEKSALFNLAQQAVTDIQTIQTRLTLDWSNFVAQTGESAYLQSPDELLQLLNGQLKSVEDFARHYTDYQQFLAELAEMRDRQNNLSIAAETTLKLFLETEDELNTAHETAELKQARYRHEQQRVNFDRERERLTDGQPCPLCGSEHHPYAHAAAVQAFADDAEREWQKAQLHLTQVQKRYVQLTAELRQLGNDMRQSETRFGQLLDEQAADLTRQANAKELILNELQNDWQHSTLPLLANGEWLNQQIEQLRNQRDTAQQLQQRIRHTDTELLKAKNQAIVAENDLNAITQTMAHYEEQLSNSQSELTAAAADFDRLMAPHAVQFDEQGVFVTKFNELKQLNLAFNQQQQQQQLLQTQLADSQNALGKTQTLLTERTKTVQAARAAQEIAKQAHTALLQQRQSLFGDTNPDEEQQQWKMKTDQLAEVRESAQAQYQAAQQALVAVEENIKQAAMQVAKATQQQQVALEQLPAPAEATPEWPQLLLAQLLPADVAEAFTQQEQTLAQTHTALTAQMEQCQAQLRQCPENWVVMLETTSDEIKQQETQLFDYQREIGSIEQQLSSHFERERQANVLVLQYEQLKTDAERWRHLSDLIGSADGLAFRRFAQGLTLTHLVALANRHLTRLHGGRYRLQKRSSADLELEMVDTFQADHVRSVNSLSGGETFLVSLALALGLADLTGRKTRVQSLFIDEGFGALDESALELAVSTLESLQAQGLTIGVISHIREMKERIQTQIRVVKQSDGFSRIELAN